MGSADDAELTPESESFTSAQGFFFKPISSRKIAVVGAGFCGLAAAWYLIQNPKNHVSVFDREGIGAGASGIATGLLHPYPGEAGKKSFQAEEALAETLYLLDVAKQALSLSAIVDCGILRLLPLHKNYPDITHENDAYYISSGLTIDCPLYLKGLWQACAAKGATFRLQEIRSLSQLQAFDTIILALGAGIFEWEAGYHTKLSPIKGQLLHCRWPNGKPLLHKSTIAKGHVVLMASSEECLVGSTYEKNFLSSNPDLEKAKSLLKASLTPFFPFFSDLAIIRCLAGIRVAVKGHYLPLIERIQANTWMLTGMGSRGLLYHALYAKRLVSQI
jgi:glycine/D-amino acid oxidase-like deaminating enzyme